jgi:hypothetical protein
MAKAIEIKAPDKIEIPDGYKSVFLAGSIEMDKADQWQKKIVSACSDSKVVFLNPRRDDWDNSWKQTIDDVNFFSQVTWELNGLDLCDLIIMYIDPKTKSPITLLELGLHADSGKIVLYCPDGFYRKGNVDIVCEKYNVKQVESFDDLIKTINE